MNYEPEGKSPPTGTYYHYRTNNVTEENMNRIKGLNELPEIDWVVISNPHEGQCLKGVHTHVAIKFKSCVRLNKAKQLILENKESNYYLQAKYRHSSLESFLNYITKTGIYWSSIIVEKILKKEETMKENKEKKNEINEIYKERIKRAKNQEWDWFEENEAKWTLSTEFSKLYAKYNQAKNIDDTINGELENYWIYGTSGTGKSSVIQYLYPDRYKKLTSNEKWDGYSTYNEGHKIVHIDELNNFKDIDIGLEGLAGLKRMADRNPFNVRKNYSAELTSIRPKSFYITSNYKPSQLFQNLRPGEVNNIETEIECINRKFKVMHISEFLYMHKLKCVPNKGIYPVDDNECVGYLTIDDNGDEEFTI
nr:MAG: replication associated protein [Cressdnaviricota sp.]